jgi:hypothetical protein
VVTDARTDATSDFIYKIVTRVFLDRRAREVVFLLSSLALLKA